MAAPLAVPAVSLVARALGPRVMANLAKTKRGRKLLEIQSRSGNWNSIHTARAIEAELAAMRGLAQARPIANQRGQAALGAASLGALAFAGQKTEPEAHDDPVASRSRTRKQRDR